MREDSIKFEQVMKGKVTLVTGAAQGIGKGIALYFAGHGSDICIGDINYELALEINKEIEAHGVQALAIDVDTSEYLQVEQMIKKVVKNFGHIDILINNAAYVIKIPFLDYTEETWNKIIGVSLNGYFYCGQLAAKAMIEKGPKKGKIINIASIVGFIPHGGLMAYSVAKAGVIAMTKLMSHELRKNDISVNAVVPAITDTPLMQGVLEKIGSGKGPMLPREAISTAEDVARVVFQIANDRDNLLNGNIIHVGSTVLGE